LAKIHDEKQKKNTGKETQVPRKFMNYIEYDFSKMKDSKGGFMVDDDEAKKAESEAILNRHEQLDKYKKPFFDPRMSL
jgi:hypothetical protein